MRWRRGRTGRRSRKCLRRLGCSQGEKFLKLRNYILTLLKYSITPVTIVHPIPLIPYTVTVLACSLCSCSNLYLKIILAIAYSSLLMAAANLWNHLNDAEIDIKFGREDLIHLLEHRTFTIILVATLFATSLVIVLKTSHSVFAVLHAAVIVTLWAYSDRVLLSRIVGFRFKEHYATEVATYVLVVPLSTFILWSLIGEVGKFAVGFSIAFALSYLSMAVLKDLKDLTADSHAGYRTLGVVLDPRNLLRLSASMNITYHVLTVVLAFGIFGFPGFVLLSTALLALTLIWKLHTAGWRVSSETVTILRLYPIVNLLPFALLAILGTTSLLG